MQKPARAVDEATCKRTKELMTQFAAGCPVHLPPPIVEVSRTYVSRSWSKNDFSDYPGPLHYEVGYKNIPAKHPDMWCDSRVVECFNKEDAEKLTTALNFAHQQGIIQ